MVYLKLKYILYKMLNFFHNKLFWSDYIEKNLYFILEKWNWWSPNKYKIDMNAKIEYILQNATYNNMNILRKYIERDRVINIWNRINNDQWTFKLPKKNLINNYLEYVWKNK